MVLCEPSIAKWGKAGPWGLGGEIQDRDSGKDKDKDKVQRGTNICYIFENQGVQGYQI